MNGRARDVSTSCGARKSANPRLCNSNRPRAKKESTPASFELTPLKGNRFLIYCVTNHLASCLVVFNERYCIYSLFPFLIICCHECSKKLYFSQNHPCCAIP